MQGLNMFSMQSSFSFLLIFFFRNIYYFFYKKFKSTHLCYLKWIRYMFKTLPLSITTYMARQLILYPVVGNSLAVGRDLSLLLHLDSRSRTVDHDATTCAPYIPSRFNEQKVVLYLDFSGESELLVCKPQHRVHTLSVVKYFGEIYATN